LSNTFTGTSVTLSATTGTETSAQSCADYVPEGEDKWYDPLGAAYDCEWYATDDDGDHCGEFGSDQSLNFNRTANEACCVCGGGFHYTQTTTITLTSTTECFDWQPDRQEAWSDGQGHTCKYYERELLVKSTCSESESFGMTAIQACCACGGGVGHTDSETFTGTFSATLSATTSSATFTQTTLPFGGYDAFSSGEDTLSSSSLATILGLTAAGLLAAGVAGLFLLRFGRGFPTRTPQARPKSGLDTAFDDDAFFIA